MGLDYYAVLGVPYNATSEEVRGAYFQLARQLHPDMNPDPLSREQFLLVQQAYETLSNQGRRARYDASLPPELRVGPEVAIHLKYSRSALPRLDEPQLLYVLMDLLCTAEIDESQIPASHICLALDRSTSMRGERMDMVKSSALNLLQQLRPQDLLSVVTFSDRASVLVPPTRASGLSRSDFRINLLQTSGGTEVYQGLLLGVEQLRKTNPTYQRHLLLLTDGHTYGDDEACLALAKEVAGEGISISVLGIGQEWNDVLMDQLAGLSGGNAVLISAARDLDHFIERKLGQLEQIYARGVHFEFESAAGVKLKYAFRLNPDTGPLMLELPIHLGNIQYRKSISVLLEFLLPPLPQVLDPFTLTRGPVWMELPGHNVAKTRLLVDLHLPVVEKASSDTPPAVLVEAMSRLTLYRMQEKVRAEVGAGEIEKATRHLKYLATHLIAQGDRELAHMVLVEAEHVQQTHQFSTDGAKRIKYGTRALLLPAGTEHT